MRAAVFFAIIAFLDATTVHGRIPDFDKLLKNEHHLCEAIHPENLPEECSCTEPGPLSLVIDCDTTFQNQYLNDTIGIKVNLDPCNDDGSRISLDITEKEHNIDYPITGIKAGETKNIPIPGLSIIVPSLGHVGLDASVYIGGNPDQLTLKVGLNACAAAGDHDICASAIPGLDQILPYYVLKGTYSFGNICESSTTTLTTEFA